MPRLGDELTSREMAGPVAERNRKAEPRTELFMEIWRAEKSTVYAGFYNEVFVTEMLIVTDNDTKDTWLLIAWE